MASFSAAHRGVALVAVSMSLLSCGGPGGSSAGSPAAATSPAADMVIAGTLSPGGAASHSFDVDVPGPVDVTLVSLDPDAGSVGLVVGVATLGSCTELTSTPDARPGLTVSGWVVDATYCVMLQDTGDLAGRTAYRLAIKRP